MRESNIQKHIVSFLHTVLAADAIVMHIPNGLGKLGIRQGVQAKAMGLLAGAPDLQILLPGASVIFLEVKNEKGRQSPGQKQFEANARKLGFTYHVVRSLDDVRKALVENNIETREANV